MLVDRSQPIRIERVHIKHIMLQIDQQSDRSADRRGAIDTPSTFAAALYPEFLRKSRSSGQGSAK